MGRHYEFRNASDALPVILNDLLEKGAENGSRNGRVKEHLNAQIVLTDPARREILTPGRKANVFAQIAETMWVLRGMDDARWLTPYLPRAMDYSDDGKTWRGAYGPRLRGFRGVDQLAYVVDTLKRDPLSRQAVVQIYDAVIDTAPGLDRPCNTMLQFQSRSGMLHMTVTVRSNDIMWGWSGINAFEWSVLQEIVAGMLGLHIGPLTFNIGSLHLYDRHWKKASTIVEAAPQGQLVQDLYLPTVQLPKFKSVEELDAELDRLLSWEAFCRQDPPQKLGELVMTGVRCTTWASALAYYWTRNPVWLTPFEGTSLYAAIQEVPESLYPVLSRPSTPPPAPSTTPRLSEPLRAFYTAVSELHATKHASYGDSWKKRGEQLSILANIARKVDRLGVTDEFETSSDTAIDLLVYLIKYKCWLNGLPDGPLGVDPRLAAVLQETDDLKPEDGWQEAILEEFDHYADCVNGMDRNVKTAVINDFIRRMTPVARDLWLAENGPFDA